MTSYNDEEGKLPMLFIPKVEQSISNLITLENEYALYIHIPFCEQKCHFCSIPVMKFANEELLDEYLNDLLYEMKIKGEMLKNRILKGVHIGGGTPSVLSTLQIKRLLDAITSQFVEGGTEIVFEANPASLTKDKIDMLAQYRNITLNIGIQTFCQQRLHEINRMDDVDSIKDCVRYATEKKNLHVGIDLIIGLPNSEKTDFDEDIKVIKELKIRNVFIYPYRLEKNSYFFNCSNNRIYLSQCEVVRYMEHVEEKMQNNGYTAKSIYYWTTEKSSLYLYTSNQLDGKEWVGIGSGAYSYFNHSVICNDLEDRNYKQYNFENQQYKQNVTSQLIWDMTFMVKRADFDTKRIIGKYGKIAEAYLHEFLKKLNENGYSQRMHNTVCLSAKGKVLLDDVEELIREVVLN